MKARLNTEAVATGVSAAALLLAAGSNHEATPQPLLYAPGSVPVGNNPSNSLGAASPPGAGGAALTGQSMPNSVGSTKPNILNPGGGEPLRVYPVPARIRVSKHTCKADVGGVLWQEWTYNPPKKDDRGQHRLSDTGGRKKPDTHPEGTVTGKTGNGAQNVGNWNNETVPADASGMEVSKPATVHFTTLCLLDFDNDSNRIIQNLEVSSDTKFEVPGNGALVPWKLTVTVNSVPSGRYQGYLLAARETQGSHSVRPPVQIPVLVEIRDSPQPVVIMLFIGVLISLGLQAYRLWRQYPNARYEQIAEAEQLVIADPDLATRTSLGVSFRNTIATALTEAAAKVAIRHLKDADASIIYAQNIWVIWQSGRPDWLDGLRLDKASRDSLRVEQERQKARGEGESKHLLTLLEMVPAVPPTPTVPEDGKQLAITYRDQAATRNQQTNLYLNEIHSLQKARRALETSTVGNKSSILEELDSLIKQWNDDKPDTAADTRVQIDKRVVVLVFGIASASDRSPETAAQDEALSAGSGTDLKELIPRMFEARIRQALFAQWGYRLIVGCIVYLGLILLGYQQTYLQNPIFGANPWSDYLKVAAWALGADLASRASLGAFSDGWLLPATIGDGSTTSISQSSSSISVGNTPGSDLTHANSNVGKGNPELFPRRL